MRSVAWTPRRDERHGTCASKASSERVTCGRRCSDRRCAPGADRGADDDGGRSGATLSGLRAAAALCGGGAAAAKERSGFAVNSPLSGGVAPSPRSSSNAASPHCWCAWCTIAGGSTIMMQCARRVGCSPVDWGKRGNSRRRFSLVISPNPPACAKPGKKSISRDLLPRKNDPNHASRTSKPRLGFLVPKFRWPRDILHVLAHAGQSFGRR